MPAHIPVSENTDPREQYAVGSTPTTGPWTFDFPVFAAGDVIVVKTVAGVDTELVLGVDYTQILNSTYEGGYDGGSITAIAPLSDCTLTIYRDTPIERTDDFPNTGSFNIKTLNTTLGS